jgi:hypothetical protein
VIALSTAELSVLRPPASSIGTTRRLADRRSSTKGVVIRAVAVCVAILAPTADSHAGTFVYRLPCHDGTLGTSQARVSCDDDGIVNRVCDFRLRAYAEPSADDAHFRVTVGHRRVYSYQELFVTYRFVMKCHR